MRIAVIGGGINGAGIAWELARKNYDVTLFERACFGGATSSATTKMIHGGLRYLEHFDFRLVHESLRERAWLLRNAPHLVRPLEIFIPILPGLPRPPWMIAAGLGLYDLLAGRRRIRNHRFLDRAEALALPGGLRDDGLRGVFSYWDAQVDDHALVQAVIAAARRDGAIARDHTPVTSIRKSAGGWTIELRDGVFECDVAVVTAGPWMNEVLARNGIRTTKTLSLVRGSHLVLNRTIGDAGFLIQHATDNRILFVLPWKGQTLVGTTEVFHESALESVSPTEEEITYLLALFNEYFDPPAERDEISYAFAGVRPLVREGAAEAAAITRDYAIESDGGIVTVFGGKMTTFMALAREVGKRVDRMTGRRRTAREPVFDE